MRVARIQVVLAVAAAVLIQSVVTTVGSNAGHADAPLPSAVSLTTSLSVVPSGSSSSLLATTDVSVSGTGYVTAIYDTTTSTRLTTCNTGTSCPWSVGFFDLSNPDGSETPHVFQAFVETVNQTDRRASSNTAASAQQAFTATATVSKATVANLDTTTVSASTNQSVSGIGYVIAIYDTTTSTRLSYCTSGTTCSASVNFMGLANSDGSEAPHLFQAYVETVNQTNRRASSNTVGSQQQAFTATLATSKPVVANGEATTLTATTNQPVNGTGYVISLYDTTTSTRLTYCTTTSTCGWSVTFSGLSNADGSEAPHVFQAFVETTNQTNRRASSNQASSAQQGFTATTTASKSVVANGDSTTISGSTNQSVSGTGYVIAIYDSSTATKLAYCTTGTTCSATVNFMGLANADGGEAAHTFQSVVETVNATNRRASSNTVSSAQQAFTAAATASKSIVPNGDSSVISVTTNQSVSGTGYVIAIYDVTAGIRLGYCTSGTTCSATATFGTLANADSSEAPHVFQAYVETVNQTKRRGSSNTVSVAQQAFSVTLTASSADVSPGASVTLSAVTNQSVSGTGSIISFYDGTKGTRLGYCGSGTTCSVVLTAPDAPDRYMSLVETAGAAGTGTARAFSNTLVLPTLHSVGIVQITIVGVDADGNLIVRVTTTGSFPAGTGPILVLDPGGVVPLTQVDAHTWTAALPQGQQPPILQACIVPNGHTDCAGAIAKSEPKWGTPNPVDQSAVPPDVAAALVALVTKEINENLEFCAKVGTVFRSNEEFKSSASDAELLCTASTAQQLVNLMVDTVGLVTVLWLLHHSPSKPLPELPQPPAPPAPPAPSPVPPPAGAGTFDAVDELAVALRARIPNKDGTNQPLYLPTDDELREAARQCMTQAALAGANSPFDVCDNNNIFWPGSDVLEPATHDFEAIFGSATYNSMFAGTSAAGLPPHTSWFQLNRWSTTPLPKGWYGMDPRCAGTQVNVTDCDEYPYRVTVQANPSSLRPVDFQQNRAEGGFLRSFYAHCPVAESYGVTTDESAYLVVPMPAAWLPTTFSTCRS